MSKSVLGYICILESCFPVKVWIIVLGAKTFVVLLCLGVGTLSLCVSAKLVFGLGRVFDFSLYWYLYIVDCNRWAVRAFCCESYLGRFCLVYFDFLFVTPFL
jgi:hypothetical protein